MDGQEIIDGIKKINSSGTIKNFRGIILIKSTKFFQRGVDETECGIIKKKNHWTCYWKDGNIKYYFDSFGKKHLQN